MADLEPMDIRILNSFYQFFSIFQSIFLFKENEVAFVNTHNSIVSVSKSVLFVC